MDFITYAARLEYLIDLARKDKIPSPHTLGKKFECSERTVRRMINVLRDKGFVIKYDAKNQKYSCLKS